jgi:hypothetical protein
VVVFIEIISNFLICLIPEHLRCRAGTLLNHGAEGHPQHELWRLGDLPGMDAMITIYGDFYYLYQDFLSTKISEKVYGIFSLRKYCYLKL